MQTRCVLQTRLSRPIWAPWYSRPYLAPTHRPYSLYRRCSLSRPASVLCCTKPLRISKASPHCKSRSGVGHKFERPPSAST
jgi:hypothetical protein